MGTKGRDLCLWLFFALAMVCFISPVTARIAIFMVALPAALFMYYCAWYQPSAVRKSRESGLRMVVLLPVNTLWAKVMLRLERERMEPFFRAYEVHIKSDRRGLGDYLQMLESDLKKAADLFPGALFMWETSAPLPLAIRRLIRLGTSGTAFLKKGRWPVPRFPFTGRDLKRGHIRHGAIVNRRGLVA